MANFLLIYHGGSMPEGEVAQAQVMQAWHGWFEKLGEAVVDGGNPFTPVARTIQPDGSVRDGAGSASGYSIISASSLDEAVSRAKECPVLGGGASISVHETFPVM